MRKLLCSVLFLAVANSQGLFAGCLDDIKAMYMGFGKITQPTKNSSYLLDFNIKTTYWANIPPSTMHVNVVYAYNYYAMLSDNMNMYMDSKESIAIVSTNKLIYRMDSKLKSLNDSAFNPMKMKLFDLVASHTCQTLKGNKNFDTMVKLTMNEEARKTYYVNSVVMYYNSNTKKLYKTIMEYVKPYPCSQIEFEYNVLNFNYKYIPSGNQILDRVFDSKGKLLPAYAGFKVFDAREKNTK